MEGKLVSAYILKIKLESFTRGKLNITLATALKTQGLWQILILWEVVILTPFLFCFHGNTWP